MSELAADGIPVAVTCRVLKFAKQPYYRWLEDPVSQRDWDDAHLVNAAIDVHADDPAFGYRFLERLMREDPLRMPERTQEAVAAWVELAVDQRVSVLVEGTFRRPEVTIGTAERFHDAGYRTHLVAVAVPGWESRLSTVERFVTDHREGRTARWTPPAAHDAGLTGSPSTLRAAASSTAVDRISVVTRRGQGLFDGTRPGDLSPAAAVLQTEQRRMPAAAVLREWQHRYRAVVEYIEREVPRSAATTDSLRVLRAEAVTLERAGREAGRPVTGPQLAPGRGASL